MQDKNLGGTLTKGTVTGHGTRDTMTLALGQAAAAVAAASAVALLPLWGPAKWPRSR